jgi:hypothetical protein
MSSSTSSPGNYQLKSTTLRNDGHLLYELMDLQSSSHQCSIAVKLILKLASKLAAASSWKSASKPTLLLALVLASILSAKSLYKLFLRAEKNARLRDFVAGRFEALDRALIQIFCLESKIKDFELEYESLCSAWDWLDAKTQCLQTLVAVFPNDLSASGLESAYNILVSAVVLSIVY